MTNGNIFNIQKFSIHDGPGIRTTVFVKGCNLSCVWCHNPESQSGRPQIQFFPQKCIGCGECVRVCENGCHTLSVGQRVFDREHCIGCGKCAEVCYSEALLLTGKVCTPAEIFAEVIKDAPFYGSDGGVTFSGGEPLLQPDFVADCAALCKNAAMTVAVDTAGCVNFSAFERVMPNCDLFLFDVKHCDPDKHLAAAGVELSLIRTNLVRLLSLGARVWIRVPVIPCFNDSEAEITAIAQYISEIFTEAGAKAEKIELMPFHRTAAGKYDSLGRVYQCRDMLPPTAEHIARLYKCIRV